MSGIQALRRFALATTVALAVELWTGAAPTATVSRVSESEVKATFLFNFVKFTSWPASALPSGAPLEVCVFGSSQVATSLEGFRGQSVDGHKLTVKRVVDPSDLQFCHLVFVTDSESDRASTALNVTKHVAALTVGEQADFLMRGGMINFAAEDNRVRFDINQAAAERVSLKISAHLLRLARQTGDGRRP